MSRILWTGTRNICTEGTDARSASVPRRMTSLTTVLGLIPLVAARGLPGGEILAPLAAVQLGGLVIATLSALIVMPALARQR